MMINPGQSSDGFHATYESAVPGADGGRFGFEELCEVKWSGPTPVMTLALDLVQADLDAAGLGQLRLSYALAGGSDEYPIVNVQWRGTWTSDSIDLDVDTVDVAAVDAARQTAQGLIELEGIYFPVCPEHNRRASANRTVQHEAAWVCQKRGKRPHALAPIGGLHLVAAHVRGSSPLWQNLAALGPP